MGIYLRVRLTWGDALGRVYALGKSRRLGDGGDVFWAGAVEGGEEEGGEDDPVLRPQNADEPSACIEAEGNEEGGD